MFRFAILNSSLGEKANTNDFLATKVYSFYSGDGIGGYASKDFSLNFTRPTGYTVAALKEIVTNSGSFIFSVRNISNTSLQVRAFNCSSTIANPGTITYAILFAKSVKSL